MGSSCGIGRTRRRGGREASACTKDPVSRDNAERDAAQDGSCPDEIAPLFAEAEEVVSRYFRAAEGRSGAREPSRSPASATCSCARRRSPSSSSRWSPTLFGPGRENEAEEFARNILFDLAHAIGQARRAELPRADGPRRPDRAPLGRPGPLRARRLGVRRHPPGVAPVAGRDYVLLFDHPYSFESDAWLRAGKRHRLRGLHHERRLLVGLVRGRASGSPSCRPRCSAAPRRRVLPLRHGAARPHRGARAGALPARRAGRGPGRGASRHTPSPTSSPASASRRSSGTPATSWSTAWPSARRSSTRANERLRAEIEERAAGRARARSRR